jgi:hypothetical protein
MQAEPTSASSFVHKDDSLLIEALDTDKYMCMSDGDTLKGATLTGWLDYLFGNPEGKPN